MSASILTLYRQLANEWQWARYSDFPYGAMIPLRRPVFWLMATHRYGQWAMGVRVPVINKLLRLVYTLVKPIVSGLTGTDIRLNVTIGKRFNIHTLYGIQIANGVCIGDDCAINSGVCLAHSANGRGAGVPTLGNHVRIGLGAKVLGGITVGEDVIIGANAVVIRDVPPRSIAVGVPAVIKPVPQSYLDEFYGPDWPLRLAGLMD